MSEKALTKKRKPWIAGLLSLASPGLGQVYNGELLKGFCIFVISILAAAAGLCAAVLLPDPWLIWGVGAVVLLLFGLLVFAIAEAAVRARRLGAAYLPGPANHWYVYVALWLAGNVLINLVGQGYVNTRWVRMFKVPSASMEPMVMAGDYVAADLSAYRRGPVAKGDVVVFVYPDDRSKVFLKQVLGLPGETVAGADGENIFVPHGHVWMEAARKKGTVDSRSFGPVPLADIIGKVRQVYFSKGPDGVRWSRVGLVVNGEEESKE